MELTYAFTDEDALAALRHMTSAGPMARGVKMQTRRMSLIGWAINFAIGGSVLYFFATTWLSFIIALVLFVPVMFALGFGVVYLQRLLAGNGVRSGLLLERGWRRLIESGAVQPFRGEIRARLSADCAEFESSEGFTRINTSCLERIECAEGQLFLWRRNEIAAHIPLRAFASDADREAAILMLAGGKLGAPPTRPIVAAME